MAIVGDRPEHGVRLRLDRVGETEAGGPVAGAPPGEAHATLVYEGQISTPDADFAVRVVGSPRGEVTVETDAGPELAEKTRLIVRTVLRHAASEGEPPPRRIQRWRGEK